jgi:hypothetical protein
MTINNCEMVCDLLPIYVEGMASKSSSEYIERHLNECAFCRGELEKLKESVIKAEDDKAALKKIQKRIKKQKLLAVLLAVAASVTVLILAFGYVTAPQYLPFNEGLVSIVYNNGLVIAEVNDKMAGYSIETSIYSDGRHNNVDVSVYTSIISKSILKGKSESVVLNPGGEKVASVYYVGNDGNPDRLIYGLDQNRSGGRISLPRLVLGYYLIISAVIFIILLVARIFYRKHEKPARLIGSALFIPLSYMISHLLVKGFNTISFAATRDFFLIMLVSVPVFFAQLILSKIINTAIKK